MTDKQSLEKIKLLERKTVWSIGDITWIMLGREDCSGHFHQRITSLEPENDYCDLSDKGKACVDLLEEILGRFNSGHFGRLFVENMSEFEEWHAIHRLRVVDWVSDTNILESSKFKQNHPPKTQQKILTLFKEINAKRPQLNDVTHEIDFDKLAQSDSWVLTELRMVLFGETYLNKYHPNFYQKLVPETEDRKREVDRFIESAVTLEKIKEYKSKSYRQPLATYAGEGCDYFDDSGHDTYIGVYDLSEIMPGVSVYKPNELMKVLRERGLPIPDELTKETYQAANKSSLTPLLRSLRGEIQHWLENGCPDMTTGSTPKNPQTKDSQKSSQLRTPSGTSWSEIGFTYHSKNNSFSIKVKSKTLHCTPEEFFKLLPSKTSLELLLTITRAGGTFEKDLFDGNALKYFHKYLYRLRETLKDIFCIHEDPIESLGQGQFKTKFRARHRKNPDSLDAL